MACAVDSASPHTTKNHSGDNMTSRLTHWARRLPAAAALTLCAIAANAAYAADPVKIGFLV
jgi:hypothetical protein